MRCVCCDAFLDDPKTDPRDGSIRPCTTCEDVIDETVRGLDNEDEDLYYIGLMEEA